ncbi:hypothetical protein M3629_01075 [Paenibacillus polysaccharolyticus]|uniref:DMP19 family protein n=1 Tax=Paenibacillus polysaccharolyticus TaxID=582692 RepID=UPI00203FA23B|nr:hypothetical protein [Paenibacillus polysaccharolyticus]MCM3131357.1 hypothetical protein [Paenibacillus polysaccharolyticus]
MNKLQEELAELMPPAGIEEMSGEEIVGSVAMDMYRAEFSTIREHVSELPVVMRDMMLIIDLDTELSMNGLTGYLENSSGQHLKEVTEALIRSGNETDAMILQKVEQLLAEQSVTVGQLRENVERLSEHDITTSLQTHGAQIHELLQQVEQEGQHLSFKADNEENFDLLYQYVDEHKNELKQQLEQFLVL